MPNIENVDTTMEAGTLPYKSRLQPKQNQVYQCC